MPYRHIQPSPNTCIICSAKARASCRNCHTSHCDAHMMEDRCAGCEGALWTLERRRVKGIVAGYSVLAFPTAAVAAALVANGLIATTLVAVAAPALAVAGLFAATRLARLAIHRGLANKPLKPSSVRMLPPAKLDDLPANTEPKPRRRPRHGMRPRRPRPPRAVFMTRGGYFYQ